MDIGRAVRVMTEDRLPVRAARSGGSNPFGDYGDSRRSLLMRMISSALCRSEAIDILGRHNAKLAARLWHHLAGRVRLSGRDEADEGQ